MTLIQDARASRAAWFVPRRHLCSAFLASGVLMLADFPGAVAEACGLTGLAPAVILAALVITVQRGGSVLVLAGGRALWLGSALLARFTALTMILGHPFCFRSGIAWIRDLTFFLVHAGFIAGFLFATMIVACLEPPR